jgi:glycolate oxidase FAD binding subunit
MAPDPVEVLSPTGADVRKGRKADAVAGVTPAAVAAPGSAEQASALLSAASAHGLAMVPRGAGTKLDWGLPPRRCDVVVDTARLDRITEHAAGDLVVRVQAGVPVRRLQDELGRAGQQLAMDTPDGDEATIGGLVATGMAGPRRLRYGAPRDLLIGITVVLSDGTVASSGGKVVKNVAGYDLGKLFAGSRGTLGLIAEATFRLHPQPPEVSYVTLSCDGAAAAAEAVRTLMGTQLAPSACEIDRPRPGAPVTVAVLLEGRPDAVAERSAKMRAALDGSIPGVPGAPGVPGGAAAAAVSPAGGTLLQLSCPPGALQAVLDAVDEAASGASPAAMRAEGRAASGSGALEPVVRGSAGTGVLAVGLAAGAPPAAVGEFVTALRELIARHGGELPGGSVTVLHAPPAVRDSVDLTGPIPAVGLMRAVKDQFDPGHLMAPGRLTGGI